ncbi:aldehyde dehydrogenase (NADP(+)) [Streptomyces sp. NPDC057382]|uniref:aldehyde dehydrogenase (NADP(+)) n=1 Tax=unclassified Streptomyces TaxID=2593676 RepID=UPI00362F5188
MSSSSPQQEPAPAVRAAADAAERAAAATGLLADLPLRERADLLGSLADSVKKHAQELVSVGSHETGLTPVRLESEVRRTEVQLRMFADIVRSGAFLDVMVDLPDPKAIPAPRPDLRRMLVPIGPVAVFSASNFPLAFSVLGGDTASALAAGCPVVVKAHEGHPRLSTLTAELASAVLPAGTLSLVQGREAGPALVRDSHIRAVGFTGSTSGGRALFDMACARPDPIPFYGELGSLNPVIVTAAALADRGERVAHDFVASLTFSQGQLCTKPGVLFLPTGHGLEAQLAEEADAVPAAPMLGQWIHEGYTSALAALAGHPHVRVITGRSATADTLRHDAVIPTLLSVSAETVRSAPELLHECFGPAGLIVEYESREDLLATLPLVPPSLTTTVHGREGADDELARLVLSAVPAGRLLWNSWPTGVAVTQAMHHGGPWPATTSPLHTSVGGTAIARWLRPVVYQNMPDALLPAPLRRDNPLRVPRRINGVMDQPAA